ncbi:MAG: hypothetical protein K6F56_00445 [Oscillospiraceae bacterium]|nr:hypothetical protein [Oscillospiraceae bacterium]
MKKILALLLVLVLFFSFNTVAFAAVAQDGTAAPPAEPDPKPDPAPIAAEEDGPISRYKLYNAADELIGTVPAREVLKLTILGASDLSREDGETFLKYYRASQNVTGKSVKYILWVNIPESYKTDDLAYMVFPFDCSGKDVEAEVNGNSMEVVKIEAEKYYVKMADFGALTVTRKK